MIYKRKLIEVALPLEAINREAAREKSIRHGHPSTLHIWWARRPLAACRAMLFASLVDDPTAHPDRFPTEGAQAVERQRLFELIEDLVKWENTTNERLLTAARKEILRSCDSRPPAVLDPFCGGGSIPLEAQRLGLEAHASDLNPVAVLITRALIELPPKFAGRPPLNPESQPDGLKTWSGAQGLADDVRYYGRWMRNEAERRIGHLYPAVRLPRERGGGDATVIAWIWARTVKCPNPACGAQMPLVSSFVLSTKKGRERWIQPNVDLPARTIRWSIGGPNGDLPDSPKVGQGARFRCVVCKQTSTAEYVHEEIDQGRSIAELMAIAAATPAGRVYLPPTDNQREVAKSAGVARATLGAADRLPTQPARGTFGGNAQGRRYGFRTFADYFTDRQLVALTTFADLVTESRQQIVSDGGDAAYADAVATYLAFAVDRLVDRSSTLCSWDSSPKMEALRNTFARQAISMTWDFAEGNVFSDSSGNFLGALEYVAKVVERVPTGSQGFAVQSDAAATSEDRGVVSTDPPYYDNIGYGDLSDFFYVWLRHSLKDIYPDDFSTLLVPKTQELIANPYRFDGDKLKAESHFERGLSAAFARMRKCHMPDFPLTIVYGFKQSEDESRDGHVASTGWETMLEALLRAGFSIDGTWPIRSELGNRMVASGTNALASSIVLVCRPRPANAPLTSRKDFHAALKKELPGALRKLQQGNIAPVDLAQAAIGPGMGVFSRYSKVIEADGALMTVRTALALINQVLDETLSEQEGDFDADTRWAIAWFEQNAMNPSAFGSAETLSKAKNTGVNALVLAGVVESKGGKVKLLDRDQLDGDWDPVTDRRVTIWEMTQHLIRALEQEGERGAAEILRKVGGAGETARELAYRLYNICERKKWAKEALAYNSLVVAWPEIRKLASAALAGQQQLEV